MKNRKLRMGMVGGGKTGFIGAIHLRAALMENMIELVCGCFSSDPERSLSSGRAYFLPDDRIYGSYQEMFDREMELPEAERMNFVVIVTPNKQHFEPAMMALERGIHVVLDKPMTFSLEEALKLQQKVEETGLVLALTHVYTGYPAVKEMKARIAAGELGKIRRVYVEYPQGWLSDRIELQEGNNAGWRTDPQLSGKAGCMGDIGTHAWHLCEYVTGLKVEELCAELNSFVPGRMIDDDGTAFMRLEQGAKALLSATQIAIGEANKVNIRVYGDWGGLQWIQENPNELRVTWGDKPEEIIRIGNNSYLGSQALWNARTPAGHPEGFIEAFANIYRNFTLTVKALQQGEVPTENMLDFPNVYDGVRGMQFIETVVTSGYSDSPKWVKWILS
ncbi:MAG: oxidoreductase [Bacteroidetes bacterium GWD2_45_23]|nr:MAG: oxidoreductase [Bacteroidetes bacterium GWC2_46_850]OFX72595.1 MAG: oxidoreductase [Bacteroidetes bacterium GWC1_47_7]OFX87563.1 MAG: oxidoreductase [Bacteroidetes bacterium GWD2_45_23]HBB01485.1 oxidoreductase [Porphyromonadaceae bacterium]HCC19066.1 oxidoreductase [Porphyromonadaceae bacterium]